MENTLSQTRTFLFTFYNNVTGKKIKRKAKGETRLLAAMFLIDRMKEQHMNIFNYELKDCQVAA